jgi:hypothetical protein
MSELGNTLSANNDPTRITGKVVNALDDQPIEGVHVVSSGFTTTTESDGTYELLTLHASPVHVDFRDEFDHSVIGQYVDVAVSRSVNLIDSIDAALIPSVDLETTQYPDAGIWFREMTHTMNSPPHPFEDNLLRTWVLPISVYVPSLIQNDLDYQQTIKSVFRDWEQWMDLELFTLVDEEPDVGVTVAYTNTASRDRYDVLVRDDNLFPVKGTIYLRRIYDAPGEWYFRRVVAHEIGHALGMAHSTDPIHLMIGSRAPELAHPSPDEVWLVRTMYHLPRGTDMDFFVWD